MSLHDCHVFDGVRTELLAQLTKIAEGHMNCDHVRTDYDWTHYRYDFTFESFILKIYEAFPFIFLKAMLYYSLFLLLST